MQVFLETRRLALRHFTLVQYALDKADWHG